MKKNRVSARARPAQQDLFAEATRPLAIPPAMLEEVRSAIAELLLEAVRTSGKEVAGEPEGH
jgi:hypothetical protein